MTLFHSKKQPNESADKGRTPRKRGIGYYLEIRCRGKLVRTILMDDPDTPLTIGRAADNDLVIPEDDRSCGEHHAKLHIVQNGVKLSACEKNRIHFHGESVSSTVLKKNDRASIGDSEIFVKSTSEAASAPCDVHRLETHGGERNGEIIRLEKSPFRIGSAADNDLVLKSDVVSRHHAEIRIAENGETWLRDLGSSNGTFVNGERLKRQERMLMDLDEISVAFFDYAFLDRNVVHTRTHFGKKILILVFTLFVVAGVFGLYYMMSPQTETVIDVIDYYLRQNNYGAAKRVLTKMPDSKGFQRYKKQYRDYATSIPNYENTYNALLSFRNELKDSQWSNAAECFGRLELDNPDAWNQADPQTPGIQHQVQEEKKMLDTQLSLRNMVTSLDTTVDELKGKWKEMQPLQKRLKDVLEAEPTTVPDYLHPLYQAILHQLSDLENDCGLLQKIESKLNDLLERGDLKQITDFINFLTNDESDISGILKVYKRDLLNRMKIIRDNLQSLDENDQALFDLRLDDIRRVHLISSDDCVMIPQLFKLRERMGDRLLAQFRGRDQWRGLQESLEVYRLEPGRLPEVIAIFSNEALLERVFSLSDLSSSETRVVSAEYEKLFGERYFYEVLQQTVHSSNNLYASDLLPDIQYVPQCIHLKDMYRKIAEALVWCNLPQNEWMMHGRIQETKEYYQAIMDTRKNVLNVCLNIASRNKNNRQYFLSKTAYFFFAPFTPDIPAQMQAFGEEWRQFRLEQQNHIYSYDPMDESKAAQIKAHVIKNGIPGDPLFNWVRSLD
ncbi:MAG: FHA domain-containing protein [Lentisphaeria bacterium]|nr:FHA domain-containing protein [Lentisphaeria bacterium]